MDEKENRWKRTTERKGRNFESVRESNKSGIKQDYGRQQIHKNGIYVIAEEQRGYVK